MKKPPHLKAIIFDMDGVITLTMPYHFRAWRKVFNDAGLCISKFEVYAREGQTGIRSVMEIFKEHRKPITKARAKELLHQKETLFKTIGKTPFVTGARPFIKKYHGHGMKLALVTGTARHEIEKIIPEQLLACFDVLVSGSDVRNGKPHPEPYQKAIKSLNVCRGEAIVIENAPFGITSAKSAGIKCIAIETSLPRAYLQAADHIVSNYQEIEGYLKQQYNLSFSAL